MESTSCHEPLAKKEGARLDQRCSIHVHSRTKKLADSDGRSCKALIDGLVEAGILISDNPKCVKEVTQSQEVGEDETVVDIIWDE